MLTYALNMCGGLYLMLLLLDIVNDDDDDDNGTLGNGKDNNHKHKIPYQIGPKFRSYAIREVQIQFT